MSYRVRLTATAEKQRKRLPADIRARLDRVIEALKADPRPPGVAKLAGSQHDWRTRTGDYRILYEIDNDNNLITVWRIAHRREAYQP
ncbi:MAG: type II toxin-antitoxin system RelE/ParE family toxin [Chloroflexi bacterium]|nr:type II toxin-antitoxin system RelE/ParE family toxin [Chloroflexota bacterium]